jgi:hypothetical protein
MVIAIQNLHPSGHDLFIDHESYLQDLSSSEKLGINGGFDQKDIEAMGTIVLSAIALSAELFSLTKEPASTPMPFDDGGYSMW